MDQKPSNSNKNLIRNVGNQFKLIMRLMQDQRVSPFLKLLPFGSLVYFISPFDFLPINPIDDVGVIWFFVYLFLELVPADLVREHQVAIEKEYLDRRKAEEGIVEFSDGDIVDAEFTEKED